MTLEDNKTIVRKANEELWGKGDLALLEMLYAPSGMPMGLSAEQVRLTIAEYNKAVPDLQTTIVDLIAEGDQVVCHWRQSGTNIGPISNPILGLMPPAGKPFAYTGITIYRIADGKIVSDDFQSNWTDMLIKMGVNPMPGAPT